MEPVVVAVPARPPSSRPRGYAKGRSRRAEIIEKATALFGQLGYRASSLREIAEQCGITQPGLLHHFPTKEALLVAVLQHRDEEDLETFFGPPMDGLAQLLHVLEVVRHNETRPRIVELFAVLSAEATAGSHPAHQYFADRYARVLSVLTEAFRDAQARGLLLVEADAADLARELIALLDGLQLQWLIEGRGFSMATIVRRHLEARLRALE